MARRRGGRRCYALVILFFLVFVLIFSFFFLILRYPSIKSDMISFTWIMIYHDRLRDNGHLKILKKRLKAPDVDGLGKNKSHGSRDSVETQT